MNRFLSVAVLTVAVALAQPPALRKGIRVEMTVTKSAEPMREADEASARIVAVTRNGETYLEAASVTSAALLEEFRAAGSARVYVKADARASYASVAEVLTALRATGAQRANLLSSQGDAAGRSESPMGLSVSLGRLQESGEKAVILDPSGPLLFGDVVAIIDASRSAGAKVFLK
jgi:biopolymer transport protein ExbD